MVRYIYIFVLGFFLSQSLLADGNADLAKAYQFYQKRGDGIENITAAKKIYMDLLKDSHQSREIRKEALDRFARLSVFQGEIAAHVYKTTAKDASKIFEGCIDATNYLNPKTLGEETAQYVYWRALCIGLWAANTSKTKVLLKPGRIREMTNLIEMGQKKYPQYDGYGFNRIQAGMYIRSKFLTAFNLYHPDKAVQLLDQSLANTDIYMSYILKSEALVAMNQIEEAIRSLQFGINELEARLNRSDIPDDLLIENEIFLVKMRYALMELK